MSAVYRTGRKLGRTIYRGDTLIGLMDTEADAEMCVAAVNSTTTTLKASVVKAFEAYEAKIARLEAKLSFAVDLAEEGWGYASEYFRDKNDFAERLAVLKVKP